MVFQLSPWGKILVMAIGAMITAITVLIVVCFLGPGCFLYDKYHPDGRSKRKKAPLPVTTEEIKLRELNVIKEKEALQYGTDVSTSVGRSSARGSVGSNTSSSTRDSTYSSLSEETAQQILAEKANGHKPMWSMVSANGSTGMDSTTDEDEKSLQNFTDACGKVFLALLFQTPMGDKTHGLLHIDVQEASGLRRRDYPSACDPYVVLQVWGPRKPWRRSTVPNAEFQTRIIRRTMNPKYQETFHTDINAANIKDYSLSLTVYDKDRFSGAIPIGTVTIPLKEVKKLDNNQEKINVEYTLSKVHRNCGELILGVTYLPTAERLTFSILRATNLRHQDATDNIQEFYPYVRVTLLNSMGRIIKKKKTIVQPGTANPLFNETLIFDIPQTLLNSVIFIITVCVRSSIETDDNISENNNDMEAEEDEDIGAVGPVVRHPPKNKDKCIGKLVVGRHARGKNEKVHWKEVVASPRKIITRTHKLK